MHRRVCFPTLVSFALVAAGWLLIMTQSVLAADVTLAWDPNSEADLAGYGIYYQKNTPGPPYLLFGYVTLAELADLSNPTITVKDLDAGARYYFAATAFDTADPFNESVFSSSLCAEIGNDNVVDPCPTSAGGDSGSSGGGGAGSGCFISTAASK